LNLCKRHDPNPLRTVRFSGQTSVTIPAGQELYSDPFELVAPAGASDSLPWNDHSQVGANAADPALDGRKLAINLDIKGSSGPITYHQEAL
jgi:hypothetical protein